MTSPAGMTSDSAAPAGRVTIVIATYNRAALLTRALESVRRQTYRDLEVIVVDDGSSDDTAEVVARIAARDDRPILYVRQQNRGCASARNAGAVRASGRWLMFLDSDDELETGAIDVLLQALVSSGADFVYSPALEVDAHGNTRLNPPVAAGRPERFAVEHFGNTNLRTGAYMLRTAHFHELGGFDESFSHNEDSDFVQRLAIRTRASYSPVPSVRCHAHAGSKSRDRAAIYGALLASSERTLAHHPEFAADLGERAATRLASLRTALAETLILGDRMDEARALIAHGRGRVGRLGRLALWLGSPAPLRLGLALGARARALLAAVTQRSGKARREPQVAYPTEKRP